MTTSVRLRDDTFTPADPTAYHLTPWRAPSPARGRPGSSPPENSGLRRPAPTRRG
ncbi:MAG: hypothetical protein WKG07_18295 [Hymenobacter sp.]